MEIKSYKIFNPKTGLFSKGGIYPNWSKNGKTWSNLGHIKNHITMLKEHCGQRLLKQYIEDDCEIIALVHVISSSYENKQNIKELI